MSCNWELFEFRVIVMFKLAAQSGSRYVGLGGLFWEVKPDIATLGIGDFQGSNDFCDFKTVFSQLSKLKMIPFVCPQQANTGNAFSRVQVAEKDKEHLPAAKLFVHRRDEEDIVSDMRGPTVWLQGVDVGFTAVNGGFYYAQLRGDASGLLNM